MRLLGITALLGDLPAHVDQATHVLDLRRPYLHVRAHKNAPIIRCEAKARRLDPVAGVHDAPQLLEQVFHVLCILGDGALRILAERSDREDDNGIVRLQVNPTNPGAGELHVRLGLGGRGRMRKHQAAENEAAQADEYREV